MAIKDRIITFGEKHQIQIAEIATNPEIPNHIGFLVEGENASWESYCMCFEEEHLLLYYVDLGVMIPKEKVEEVSALCTQLNYQLKFGVFCFDHKMRKLTLRVTQYIYGTEAEQDALLENLIRGCAVTTDAYYKDIMKCIFG